MKWGQRLAGMVPPSKDPKEVPPPSASRNGWPLVGRATATRVKVVVTVVRVTVTLVKATATPRRQRRAHYQHVAVHHTLQRTPTDLPPGIPGMGEEIEGAPPRSCPEALRVAIQSSIFRASRSSGTAP